MKKNFEKLYNIRCPKCNKEYSIPENVLNRDVVCSCGNEFKMTEDLILKDSFFKKLFVFLKTAFIIVFSLCLVIVLPVGLIIWGFHSCGEIINKTSKQAAADHDKIEAWVFTQFLVEQHLKSPKSAKYPFGGAQKHVEKTAQGKFIVRSYVDAQNYFGAEIRTRFYCELQKKDNGKFEVLQLNFQ